MNDWDRNNLDFLLALDAKGMDAWVEQATEEDFTYAQELLAMHRVELELAELAVLDETVTATPDATDYLKRFQI